MINFRVLLLCITLLLGCTSNALVKQNNQDPNRSFFSDASKCSQSAMNKQKFNVPTAGTATVIEIPIGYEIGRAHV